MTYDFERDGRSGPRFVPTWIVKAFGIDYFANVVNLDWRSSQPVESDGGSSGLVMLSALPALEEVSLPLRQATDHDLAYLTGHRRLWSLDASFSNLTGVGFEHIQFRQRLRKLTLVGCPISDDGLAAISRLENLEELNVSLGNGGLSSRRFSHTGLAHLVRLGRLETLQLEGIEVTDADLAAISKMRSLKRISFSPFPFRRATAEGIMALQALTGLQYVSVDHDLGASVPNGRLAEAIQAIATSQDVGDWSAFERASAAWQGIRIRAPK